MAGHEAPLVSIACGFQWNESGTMFPRVSARVFFSLCLVALMPSLVFSASREDAEISALIGQGVWTLSGEGVNASSKWNEKGGGFIRHPELALHEYYRENQAMFLIVRQDLTISDARRLPLDVMNYRVRGRDIIFFDVARRYELIHYCHDGKNSSAIVIGLARPEKGKDGCIHWTTKVRNAWEVDLNTGKLKDIPAEGVSCYMWGAPDSC